MKIIGIISSPNRKGNTATLVRNVLKGAAEKGAQTEEIFLPDFDIQFCRGCSACMAAGRCVQKDDFETLKQKMAAADGLVIGSPNYAFSPNAMMKRFMERLGLFEYMTSSVFGGKYIVAVSTTGGQGAEKVVKTLAGIPQNGIFQRAYVTGRVTAASGKMPVINNPKALDRAAKTGMKMVKDFEAGKTYPLQNLTGQLLNKYIMRPKFTGLIQAAGNDRMKGIYENLIHRKLIQTVPQIQH